MLIYAERSRNVYENKQNMDKVTGEYADIFGLATTTERQNAASSAKKRAMGATESRKAPAQVAVNRPTSDRYTNTTSVVPAVCAGRRDRSSGAGTRTANMRLPKSLELEGVRRRWTALEGCRLLSTQEGGKYGAGGDGGAG